MEATTMLALGKISLGLIAGFGALGSALGVLAAGSAACGAWAKQGKEGKTLTGNFSMFVGMPVSQTLYCLICWYMMDPYAANPDNGPILFGIALGVGFAQFISAYAQGKIGGAGIRCLVENGGEGTGNIVLSMGIAESIALFALVIGILILKVGGTIVQPETITAATEAVKAVAPAVGM